MTRLTAIPALLASAFLSVGASAASLTLVDTSAVDDSGILALVAGQTFTLDVVMDFTDEATIGGGFDIVFDADVFQFQSFMNSQIGDPLLGRDPDVNPGQLESWAFANFTPLTGPDLVGTVTFLYLGGVGEISTAATAGIGGPFVSAITNEMMAVDYNTLRTVPVPGAVWLMISGITAFVGLHRKRR